MPQDTLTTAPLPQEQAPKRTYTGRLRPPPAGWSSGPPEAGLDELASAAWESGQLNDKLTDSSVALNRAYSNLITKGRELGLSIDWHPLQPGSNFVEREPQMARVERWHAQVNRQLEANPELAAKLGPVTRETVSGMADQLSRDAFQKYMEVKERRAADFWSIDTLAEFGVGMGVSLTDPLEAPTAFAGMGTKTILGAIAEGAAINAGIEAARQPFVQSRQVRIGNVENWEEGVANALANVTIAGALGGTLSGAGKTIEKVFFEPGQERAAVAREESDRKFEHARVSMRALAEATAPTDPESAAIVRAALSEAEREYATARQAPDSIEPDEFATKVEEADAFLRRVTEFVARPEPRRPDPPAERLDTTDDGPAPKVGETLVEDGKPVAFQAFDPRTLGVAPEEMQYKRFSGEEGVNGAIADVETWHAPSSGKILVFERANGEMVIADGHQRRSKAIGIMQAQGREDIRLDGYLYREVDGWTVADLRLKGAQKNIREGRSDVLDTAQALRERPDAIDSSFPVSRSNIRQARQLARLSPEAWDLTRAGVLEPAYAALIGQVAPDRPAIHAPLARTLIEAAPDNVRQAENIVSEALLDYAERSVETQASLFGDDNLGRAVMYKERAQIMDAAYAWLRSERSVFKALVDKGDIARALGNELVDAANLNAKDQVELAIAAVMHSRKAGVRTAVTDMISRALDSVRREGVTPARAGQQVAREIRALVEERGFRALLDAEGPAPPQFAEAGPLFDGPGSKAHAEQADMLEGDLRPEGIEDPGVKLADAVKQPDEVTSLVDELKGAGKGGGDRTPDQILEEIRGLLKPKKEGEAKAADPVKEAQQEFQRYMKAEDQLRDTLAALTDVQKLSLIRMQYPDAYPWLNRLEGDELDDAIVGRVMAGEVKFARRGDEGTVTFAKFQSDALTPTQNKIVEMARNGLTNLDIAVEMGITTKSAREMLARSVQRLRAAGIEPGIEKGAMGASVDGFAPGALKRAAFELFEEGITGADVLQRLQSRGLNTTIDTVYVYFSNWRAAKRKGLKFAFAGPKAETANLQAAAKAQLAAAEGMSPEAIHRMFGWHEGADGKWRFEIDDSGAALKGVSSRLKLPMVGGFTKPGKGWDADTSLASPKIADQEGDWEIQQSFNGPLGDVLDHPQLFKAYPWLKNITVEIGIGDYFDGSGGATGNYRITANGATRKDALSILLHEVQHVIQAFEGFANGGNPTTMIRRNDDYILTLREELEGAGNNRKPVLEEMISRLENANATLSSGSGWFGNEEAGIRSYMALIGEEEARRVQARQGMSAGERKKSYPRENSDVPADQPLLNATMPMWVEFDPGVVALVERVVAQVNKARNAEGGADVQIDARQVLDELTNRDPAEIGRIDRGNYEGGKGMRPDIVEGRLRSAIVFEELAAKGVKRQLPSFKQLDLSDVLDLDQLEAARVVQVGVDLPGTDRSANERQAADQERQRLQRQSRLEDRDFNAATGLDPADFDKLLLSAWSAYTKKQVEPPSRYYDFGPKRSERSEIARDVQRFYMDTYDAVPKDIRKRWEVLRRGNSGHVVSQMIETLKAADKLPAELERAANDTVGLQTLYERAEMAASQLDYFGRTNGTFEFRSVAKPTGSTPEQLVARLRTEFGDGANALGRIGEINIADRPPVWAAPDTMGLTDANGRVTIFAANVAPDDLRGLVLHEGGVHAGLDRILGVAGKQRLLDDLGERMRAVAPDHPLWGASTTGSDVRYSRSGEALQYEPLARAAADDLLELAPDEWAAEIKATKYAAYRLPEGVASADLPRGYVVVLTQEGAYAVRSDNLRNREAAGAKVTEVEIEVAVDGGERAIDKSLRAAMDRVPIDTDRAHVVEETLAYLVQHAPKHSFVQRLLADVRAWLYRTFPKMRDWMTLTDADMVSLAMGAVRRRIKEAGWSTPIARTRNGAAFVEPIRLARFSDRPVMPLTDAELIDAAARLRPMQFEIFKAAREGLSSEAIAERINAAKPDATVKPETVRVNLVRLRKKGFEIPNAPRAGLSPETLRIFELKAQGLKVAQIAQRVYPDVDPEVAKNRVYVLLSVRKDRPEVNSTGPVKYARRSPDGSRSPQENRDTQVRGRSGGPGQPAVSGDGEAGQGSARGGDGQRGASPGRALATEPLPAPPVAEGDWNSRVILTPDQRASRREQFRSFVDNAVIEPEVSTVWTDWIFKNGRRDVGRRTSVESYRYSVRVSDDMHPDWIDALSPEETSVIAEVHGKEATIHHSSVGTALRSTGLGERLYMKAIDDLLERGIVVNSDVGVSVNAIAMWKSLRKKGYDVIQRIPDRLLVDDGDGQFSSVNSGAIGQAVFFVARKKPPAPDLPMSDRDIANQIDEARALSEHIPACIKGKGRAA